MVTILLPKYSILVSFLATYGCWGLFLSINYVTMVNCCAQKYSSVKG